MLTREEQRKGCGGDGRNHSKIETLEARRLLSAALSSDMFPVTFSDSVAVPAINDGLISSAGTAIDSIICVDPVAAPTPPQGTTNFGYPYALTTADLNGDGVQDLVVVDKLDSSVSILLGNNDGTFGAPQSYVVDGVPTSVVVADLTGNGKLDLVVGDTSGIGGVNILMGNGDGTFGTATSLTVDGGATNGLAVADVNGDGTPDLIVSDSKAHLAGVLLGNGNGTFAPEQELNLGTSNYPSYPGAIAVGDVNGDSRPDLVIANDYAPGAVFVLAGNGDGTFAPASNFAVGDYPSAVALKDVNGDGAVDILVTNTANNSVGLLLGNGDGTFAAQQTFAVGNGPVSLAATDLNGDGNIDLVVSNVEDNTISVLLGNGNGTFAPQQTLATGEGPSAIVIASINGDGAPDLVVANSATDTVGVFAGNGDGTFATQAAVTVGTYSNPEQITGMRTIDEFPGTAVITTNPPAQQPVATGTYSYYSAPNPVELGGDGAPPGGDGNSPGGGSIVVVDPVDGGWGTGPIQQVVLPIEITGVPVDTGVSRAGSGVVNIFSETPIAVAKRPPLGTGNNVPVARPTESWLDEVATWMLNGSEAPNALISADSKLL